MMGQTGGVCAFRILQIDRLSFYDFLQAVYVLEAEKSIDGMKVPYLRPVLCRSRVVCAR